MCVFVNAQSITSAHAHVGGHAEEEKVHSCTVPMILDHNRMLVEAEMQRKDGSWRKVRLWVDTGNPNFYMSESLANDLGYDLPSMEKAKNENVNPDVAAPAGVRIGGMLLNFRDVKTKIMFEPFWLFSAMHNDANLPSTVLKQYHLVLDYPKFQFTIAEPGLLQPVGVRSSACVHPATGIIQMDAVIDGENLSFALDNGAAYSFVSADVLERFSKRHPKEARITGTVGCANMWGWWPPSERYLPVMRVSEIKWGQVPLTGVGIVGVPPFSPGGPTLGDTYSRKAARHVDGFLGTNAFKAFRVEIDFMNSEVYMSGGYQADQHDLDIVGLTLQPQPDSSFKVIGLVHKDGKFSVKGVQPGDILVQIDHLITKGATMGTVVDALRGTPGDCHTLTIDRNGKRFTIKTIVERLL
jgi:hypothetical protein